MGCSDQEKFNPQMVSFDIAIEFKTCPLGAQTDLLTDTVCYFNLVEIIIKSCEHKKFNLIENLTQIIYEKIADHLLPYKPIIKTITVQLHKLAPPVPHVHGGVIWMQQINYE